MRGPHTIRTSLRAIVLGAVIVALAAFAGAPQLARAQSEGGSQEEIRTQVESLSGYTVETAASPMRVRFYEPTIPIPTDPGKPHLEMTESHTQSDLSSGPRSRAVASSLWPGAGAAGGFPQFANGQQYPIQAEASYPGGEQEASREAPNGGGMRAVAKGLHVLAEAKTQSTPDPALFRAGNISSTSFSTVTEKGVALSRSDSSMESVALLGGIITVDSLRTQLKSTSNGKKGATEGSTAVSGLTIAGNGYVVDGNGIRPVQEDKKGDAVAPVPSTLPGAEELRKQLGIEVELVPHEKTVEGAAATREAGGLRITVDTGPMREALNALPLGEVVGQTPDEMKQYLYPILALSPKIEFVLGQGHVHSTAAEPLDLNVDVDLPAAPPAASSSTPAGTSGDLSASTSTTTTSGGTSVTSGSAPAPQTATEPSPQVAGAAPAPQAAAQPAAAETELFGGISPALVALALGLAAFGAQGLRRLTPLAMGGGTSGTCSDGLTKTAPQL